ncbi:uncharacterized protein ALTATR162_LOCUS1537 [Alternaria atra]|uniref:J domain-containing protein n=1 Tax=Alternaria atra TaxID=119953 RepID=A0A8J2HTY8_9PLEO|nr:uncharacterized protein ALTATR162_LOCUS1537 [Alternaria atra]CAG5144393.1 unnamed protein product [Alternaria atra]
MSSNSLKDYYADLGLELGASTGAIKKAFQGLAKKYHLDKSGVADATVFRHVRETFEQLSNAEYRAQYDRSYWRTKFQTEVPTQQQNNDEGEENLCGTYATRYGAETQDEAPRASPPPVKSRRKPNEPNWQYFLGKACTAWQKEEAAYCMRHPEIYERCVDSFLSYLAFTKVLPSPLNSGAPTPKPGGMAHGMVVLMSHPCIQQSCIYKSTAWRLQTGDEDQCVFCMAVHTGGRRCPGCEVLACKTCVEKVRALERSPFEGLRSKAQCCSSGG